MPTASVIIPAHNEDTVIERCLTKLLSTASPKEFEVVVVCNGCSDDTAVRAQAFAAKGVRVVEISAASKIAALNYGDRLTHTFPRIYLDADVELSAGAARATVAELSRNAVGLAAPAPFINLGGRSVLIRAFYATWKRTPFMTHNVVGNGVYALSETGRARFEEFPNLLSDDLFVQSLFGESERACLSSDEFVIHPPKNLRSLLKVRSRIYYANNQLLSAARNDIKTETSSAASTKELVKGTRSLKSALQLIVYLAVNTVAKLRAIRQKRSGAKPTWARDLSTRHAAPRT